MTWDKQSRKDVGGYAREQRVTRAREELQTTRIMAGSFLSQTIYSVLVNPDSRHRRGRPTHPSKYHLSSSGTANSPT